MKKTLLFLSAVALLICVAGCSTAPTAVQHATPTPPATIAPFTTSATALSSNGLSLTISLNSTTYHPGEQIPITIDEKNTLTTDNNVTAADRWSVQDLGLGIACNTFNYPFGISILPGYYDGESVASITPLQIYEPIVIPCPFTPAIASYDFQPSSDIAARYTSDGPEPYLSPVSMNSEITPSGVWNGKSFDNFTSGIYTIVGGDEWGAVVILHFSVSKASP